ncbi:MAG: hydroxyproline-2-epimerase [Fuerstiella sp.]|jgi:4-hydroxyproline epimerase|nr:hydroxyproline-2-epimerase [Fuerstiella sp.]MCP4513360.1 hydroxyproline-2-epimerase [Fuerstiella sp.]MDG2130576.1 proline racemase family protein [Fuerstiella sp.]
MQRISVIDSHTGGEPTRIIVGGAPNLGPGSPVDRVACFREQFDHIRRSVILEPRGSDVLVGGLLYDPVDTSCAAGIVFFNNVGYLQMCGHGTIGLAVTLAHMGRLDVGEHCIETPVGIVTVTLLDQHRVAVRNVASYRHRTSVAVHVDGYGSVTGDIAWGGNWFFLVADHGQALDMQRCDELTNFARRVAAGLKRDGVTGAEGGVIDHIELFGPPSDSGTADGRSFVLCPGGAYDRSPCGTGTSAKLACLAADGKLLPGETWRQESIVGSIFEGSFQFAANEESIPGLRGDEPAVVPTIIGSAWVTGESELILDDSDPFCNGICG